VLIEIKEDRIQYFAIAFSDELMDPDTHKYGSGYSPDFPLLYLLPLQPLKINTGKNYKELI